MKTITCFCEHSFSIEVPDTIDLKELPETTDKILEGTFLTFICPKCGSPLKPEFPIHFIDTEKNIDISFIPEIERNSFMTGRTHYPGKRIVIGFPELQEKFKILANNLDEKAIELIKIYLLEKTGKSRDIHIYFGKREKGILFFYIEGLKDSETAIIKISPNTYKTFKHKIDHKTYDKALEEVLTPPYISVEKIRFEDGT